MRIEGADRSPGMQAGMPQGTDAVTKNIENRIQQLEQEKKKVSEDDRLSVEDKIKKRQEIQQEIFELKGQLREHQAELRREQQQSRQERASGSEEPQGGQKESTGLSQAGMKSMISADSAMKQAKVQGSVADRMEHGASVLKAEIKQDADRGASTAKKEEALASLEEKAETARGGQMRGLGGANAAVKDAQDAEAAKKAPEENEEDGQTAGKADEAEREKQRAAQQEAEREKGAAHVDILI